MLWLIVTLFSYFLFALASLIDKYLLKARLPHPKIYTFYAGILSIFALFLIPLDFSIPGPLEITLALLAGAVSILALFWFYKGLQSFEASRFIPALGGFLPIFTFSLSFLFFRETFFDLFKILSFFLLVLGSVIISAEREKEITKETFRVGIIAALSFSIFFILAKLVYLEQSFWSGFIWMRMGAFFAAFLFLFSKEIREELIKKRVILIGRTLPIFFFNQGLGVTAVVFQNLGVYLVPFALLAFVNALQGVQYVFLLILTIFLSLQFPQILKEEISKKILFQKITAILFICFGLILLAR